MGHTTAHTRLARRVTLVGAVMCATAILVMPVTRADAQSDIRTIEIGTIGAGHTI